MDSISNKHPKLIRFLSIVGVYIGVIGMILIGFMLIKHLCNYVNERDLIKYLCNYANYA